MCDDSDFEPQPLPDYRDTPEFQAVWQRVEAFEASQPVSEKLAHLEDTLARMAEIIDAEDSASLKWARAQLEAFRERVHDTPPSTSRAEFKLLDDETLPFILGEPKLHAAYDVTSALEILQVVVPQLEALRAQGEQVTLSADELRHKQVLEELKATLDEEVRDGLRRLRSTE